MKFDTIKRLSQETSVLVTGVVKRQALEFSYELDTDIEVIGGSQNYPITQKEHGTKDFLMDSKCTCSLRSRRQVADMQIRNAGIYQTYGC